MCGIVGLNVKDPALEAELGQLLTPMLTAMSTRGPDSAGVALYLPSVTDGRLRFSLRSSVGGFDWDELGHHLSSATGESVDVRVKDNTAVVEAADRPELVLAEVRARAPEVSVVGYGRSLEIYKDIGAPADICERYGIAEAAGYQAIGHTRMATESAVTTEHSHPFTPSADLCLVHNGSFSNHATQRRRLEDIGVYCDTDNDSEVAARYVGQRLADGDDLHDALRMVLKEFDGFFTLLVTTRDEFAVVRDPFACKPLVVAESPQYVAVASEYHALATLPEIESAKVFEPMPEEVHAWSR